jgi:hypothetical protein
VLDVEKAGMAGGSWTWSRLARMVNLFSIFSAVLAREDE